ncbi:hypothetical protein B6264_23935 [Kitasatospora aureofaciens]|nr:hypothetical protein B6264_23935 [Kitasatospora aureofaciens]
MTSSHTQELERFRAPKRPFTDIASTTIHGISRTPAVRNAVGSQRRTARSRTAIRLRKVCVGIVGCYFLRAGRVP